MIADRRQHAAFYYVYALTDPQEQERFTSGARKLRAVDVDGVAAIVEVVGARPAATEEALREQHALVVRLARRFDALLPIRFGAVFTPSGLDARIRANRAVIRRALDRVRGRVQMTVRLHGAPADDPAPTATGTAWLTARRDRARSLRQHAARLRRAVSRFVEEERIDPGKGNLQGTVYHLIRSRDANAYRAAILATARSLIPVGVTVTGPWPAFAFVPELDRVSSRRSRGR
jgi:Gas vesicle synthesis protein GvpL/GvpF